MLRAVASEACIWLLTVSVHCEIEMPLMTKLSCTSIASIVGETVGYCEGNAVLSSVKKLLEARLLCLK